MCSLKQIQAMADKSEREYIQSIKEISENARRSRNKNNLVDAAFAFAFTGGPIILIIIFGGYDKMLGYALMLVSTMVLFRILMGYNYPNDVGPDYKPAPVPESPVAKPKKKSKNKNNKNTQANKKVVYDYFDEDETDEYGYNYEGDYVEDEFDLFLKKQEEDDQDYFDREMEEEQREREVEDFLN